MADLPIGRLLSFKGVVGRLTWTYFVAASVQHYHVTVTDRVTWAGSMTGQVTASDPYNLRQRPLVFVAPFKGGAVRWPVETLTLHDSGRLEATLGPRLL